MADKLMTNSCVDGTVEMTRGSAQPTLIRTGENKSKTKDNKNPDTRGKGNHGRTNR